MLERGVEFDHSTIYCWVQRYAPEMEKALQWYKKGFCTHSWRVDETYIKVKGVWKYLYRAVDSQGKTIDFYLSHTRNAKAAQRFLQKTFKGLKTWQQPTKINTDQNPAYGVAIRKMKDEGKCSEELVHRKRKYLNNVIEADHGKLKRLIKPTLGFKSMKTAYATLKGFEVMRMFRKGQFEMWYGFHPAGLDCKVRLQGEIRLIERQFDTYPF